MGTVQRNTNTSLNCVIINLYFSPYKMTHLEESGYHNFFPDFIVFKWN